MLKDFNAVIEYIIKLESPKTVGHVLKRIELLIDKAKKDKRNSVTFDELESLKSEQKELIYEAYRNLRDFLVTGKIILQNEEPNERK